MAQFLDPGHVITALLLLLRISVMVILMPVLGHALVPAQVKIGIIGLLALILYPLVADTIPHIPASPLALTLLAVQEMLLAGMLAMLAQLIFSAGAFAGQVLSYQMGLAIANVFDPTTSAQTAVASQFATILAMLVWLASGAQHIFLTAISDSFQLLPIGQPWRVDGWGALDQAVADMFVLALRLVSPMLLLLLFLYVALGLLSRAVPQIQVFFVSAPLAVAVGLFAFALAMPPIVALLRDGFTELAARIPALLHALADS